MPRVLVPAISCIALWACEPRPATPERARQELPPAKAPQAEAESSATAAARERMVNTQIIPRGIESRAVIDAMRRVPRHAFVGSAYRSAAYEDRPLPIEDGQTISQPYIVALMTELADVQHGDKVLEVGTGSGYQAAVLAALGAKVFSIEIMPGLAASARTTLERLQYPVEVRHGDGYAGWPEHAPFDAIVITAAPPSVPEPLIQQLALGGKLVVPVGSGTQDLWVWTRTERGLDKRNVLPVRFVPMTGQAQQ